MELFKGILPEEFYVYWVEILVIITIVMFILYIAFALNLFKKQ